MSEEIKVENLMVEGRNAVIEAFRSGKPVDKLFVLDAVRMVRSAQLSERRKNMILSLIL